MSLLEISQIANTGERRWGVTLSDDEGKHILQTVTPLAKGETISIAKALKHKGPDSPLLEKGSPEESSKPAWIPEKADGEWSIRFTLVTATSFDLLLKLEDGSEAEQNIAKAVEVVKSVLRKAEIKWNPPEADPAYKEKESDETVTTGIPGS